LFLFWLDFDTLWSKFQGFARAIDTKNVAACHLDQPIHQLITEIEFDGPQNPCEHAALFCLQWQAKQ
jgi:hypothetical protein